MLCSSLLNAEHTKESTQGGKGIKTEFKLCFRLDGVEIGDGVGDVKLEA